MVFEGATCGCKMTAPNTIGHVYFSRFVNESRAMRAATASLSSGLADEVVCVGYWVDGLPEMESIQSNLKIVRLRIPEFAFVPGRLRRVFHWLYWTFKVSSILRAHKARVVQCHSLAALPSSVWCKWRTGARILYDAHELETERHGWGRMLRAGARLIERTLIRFVDQTTVVSHGISKWYAAAYGIAPPPVIRNLPKRISGPTPTGMSIKGKLGIPGDHVVYLYLGAIGEGRGITSLLKGFRDVPKDRHLVFMGEGELRDDVVAAGRDAENIHWIPPVAPGEVVAYASSADVGLSLIEDTCLSYHYCLPNKLFETRMAGLPVVVSDLPEMAAYVRSANCGWICPPEPAAIADLVTKLTPADILAKRNSADPNIPAWDEEASIYLDVLRPLLARNQPR